MLAVEIRKVKKDETESVKDLIKQIMGDEFASEKEAFPMTDLDDIFANYCGLGEAFFVALREGRIIGTAAVKREDERTAFLRRIFVHPGFRRQGIGSKLLDKAITYCKEVGYQEIIFKTTSTMVGAINLCQGAGFSEKARIKLGNVELLKYALFLKENSPLAN